MHFVWYMILIPIVREYSCCQVSHSTEQGQTRLHSRVLWTDCSPGTLKLSSVHRPADSDTLISRQVTQTDRFMSVICGRGKPTKTPQPAPSFNSRNNTDLSLVLSCLWKKAMSAHHPLEGLMERGAAARAPVNKEACRTPRDRAATIPEQRGVTLTLFQRPHRSA